MAERLRAINRSFQRALDYGPRWECAGVLKPFAAEWVRLDVGVVDEALPIAPGSVDLAVSVLSLHAINDLPGVLAQIRRALKPDGLFIATLFGGRTLHELRSSLLAGEVEKSGGSSPRVAPFADVRDLGTLLQRAGFALPVADLESTIARYSDMRTLVNDLRDLGETNALTERSHRAIGTAVLATSAMHYVKNHSDEDGRLRATFDIVYLTGWAPHASQQQPLNPGSARMRLSDVLGSQRPVSKKNDH